jgi:hypothetical protein
MSLVELGNDGMARKKTSTPAGWNSKPNAFNIRGTAEWKKWVEEFADSTRHTTAGLVDFALAELAKKLGFRDPPAR